MKYIDKAPPMMTGDVKKDMQSIVNYLDYLREQFNFAVAQMEKQKREG